MHHCVQELELEDHAEHVFADLNNEHSRIIRKAVYHVRKRAMACMRQGGGETLTFLHSLLTLTFYFPSPTPRCIRGEEVEDLRRGGEGTKEEMKRLNCV